MDISLPDDSQQFQPDDSQQQTTRSDDEADVPAENPGQSDVGARPQRFADILDDVDGAEDRPLDEHIDVFTRAHRELTDALGDVDRGDS